MFVIQYSIESYALFKKEIEYSKYPQHASGSGLNSTDRWAVAVVLAEKQHSIYYGKVSSELYE